MKKILRGILINSLSILSISFLIPGAIDYSENPTTLILSSLTLTLLNLLIKPIVNLLLLPINLITLGTFKWITNIFILYLATIIISEFQIKAFFFPKINFNGFAIPSINLNLFWSYFFVAFLLEVISGIIYSILK